MRKPRNRRRGNSSRRISRFAMIAGVIAVFALGATAAISLRTGQAKDTALPSEKLSSNKNNVNPLFRAAQQDRSGQIRPLTQEEAQQLADEIKGMVNPSAEGLKVERQADGSIKMDLEGHYQNVAIAKRTVDGIEQSCVDNPESAAAFLQVNRDAMNNRVQPQASSGNMRKGEVR